MNRVFVLSPANCNGLRARWVLKKNSRSDLALRLRSSGVPLGEVFTYLSALYFRGKLAYAQAHAAPPPGCPGVLIITPNSGLVPHDVLIQLPKLRGFARVPIHLKNRLYCCSLRRSARKLAVDIGPNCEVILLGSVGTAAQAGAGFPHAESFLRTLSVAAGVWLGVPLCGDAHRHAPARSGASF